MSVGDVFPWACIPSWWCRPLLRGEAITPWPMGTPGFGGRVVRLVDGEPILMERER